MKAQRLGLYKFDRSDLNFCPICGPYSDNATLKALEDQSERGQK
jgi:hypothetical protein